ncbi:MAG TPA: response regulator [Flavisolibacter sp.]|nr:response regulator [Flavisolibacter sp.]
MVLAPRTVLYVDDDADDREFLAEAINELNPATQVVCAENGMEALDYLNGLRSHPEDLPCLVVLDINMPVLDGRQTFQKIKDDPTFDRVSIIVFTSSENPQDKAMFQKLGVEMITKPNNVSYFSRIASHMLSHCA